MFKSTKPNPFFTALYEITNHMYKAVYLAHNFDVSNLEELEELNEKIKNHKKMSNELVQNLIVSLNKSFMTPIEREDILKLATRTDDITIGIEHCISHLNIFGIMKRTDEVVRFLEIFAENADHLSHAMEELKKRNLLAMRTYTVRINNSYQECDELYESALKQLFKDHEDPMYVIQLKDIYGQFDRVTTSFQKLSDTIETIIMRNA